MLCDNGYGLNIYVFVETGYIIHAPSSSLFYASEHLSFVRLELQLIMCQLIII